MKHILTVYFLYATTPFNISDIAQNPNDELIETLREYKSEWTLTDVHDALHSLMSSDVKSDNGIIFTPEYICEYIVNQTIPNNFKSDLKLIDPSCGGGIFLYAATKFIHNKTGLSIVDILENNIYGIDIIDSNIKGTMILLSLFAIANGEDVENISFNLIVNDALKNDWTSLFKCSGMKFECIVGNPPYLNNHQMSADYAKFLRNTYATTQKGVFNIFYAFVEQSMKFLSSDGVCGFIIPNNFMTITAATQFRKYILENKCLKKMVNLNLNLVFNPIKTYSAICLFDKKSRSSFDYRRLDVCDDIHLALEQTETFSISYLNLDDVTWNLLDDVDRDNISKIESFPTKLNSLIKVGVATLKDDVYQFTETSSDEKYYYIKSKDKKKSYKIEKSVVTKIIKISEVKDSYDIEHSKRRSIFPYQYSEELSRYIPIEEEKFKTTYPECYKYLCSRKKDLLKRSNGNIDVSPWYAYGRSQGLNSFGSKLIFPTFRDKPNFMKLNENNTLFCNGFAIANTLSIGVDILQKILNSKVMEYYIKNTSYCIEGEFYCYQKKYLKNFSIPEFTIDEIKYLEAEVNTDRINDFLIKKYRVDI